MKKLIRKLRDRKSKPKSKPKSSSAVVFQNSDGELDNSTALPHPNDFGQGVSSSVHSGKHEARSREYEESGNQSPNFPVPQVAPVPIHNPIDAVPQLVDPLPHQNGSQRPPRSTDEAMQGIFQHTGWNAFKLALNVIKEATPAFTPLQGAAGGLLKIIEPIQVSDFFDCQRRVKLNSYMSSKLTTTKISLLTWLGDCRRFPMSSDGTMESQFIRTLEMLWIHLLGRRLIHV